MARGQKRELAEVPDEMGRIVLGKFESKSSPGTWHEVRVGHDNVLYCTCYGWRRLRKDPETGRECAVRSCPHTRSIEAGMRRLNGGRPMVPKTTQPIIEGVRVRRAIVLDDEGDE